MGAQRLPPGDGKFGCGRRTNIFWRMCLHVATIGPARLTKPHKSPAWRSRTITLPFIHGRNGSAGDGRGHGLATNGASGLVYLGVERSLAAANGGRATVECSSRPSTSLSDNGSSFALQLQGRCLNSPLQVVIIEAETWPRAGL